MGIVINESNITYSAKDIAFLGSPASKVIDLTLGANNTNYTAPDNGYITISANFPDVNSSCYIALTNKYNYIRIETRTEVKDSWISSFIPVSKNQTVEVKFTTNTTPNVYYFRFVYLNGNK